MRLINTSIFFLLLISLNESPSMVPPAETTDEGYHEFNQYLPFAVQRSVFYISKGGNNTLGTSWESAWNELDQIDWDAIQPNSLIFIDGGANQMTYETSLTIEKSGAPNAIISIEKSKEPGRNGNVVIFGGREDLLPFCFQPDVDFENLPTLQPYGINTNDHSYISIDGGGWNGIQIHGFGRSGVILEHESTNITLRNIEIFNNGDILKNEQGVYTDRPGLILGGKNHIAEFLNIHDNGQDAIQSIWQDSQIENFTLRYSWLHNERRHPTVSNESFNFCTHSDGIQIYSGGVVKNVTVDRSFIGPGFTNALLLGSKGATSVENFTLTHSVVSKPAENGLSSQDTAARNFRVDRVIFDCWNTKWTCMNIYGDDSHSVTNSILYGSEINFLGGLDTFYGNCAWQTSGTHGEQIGNPFDPNFSSFDPDPFAIVNYQLAFSSPCIDLEPEIFRIEQLIDLSDD